MLLLSFDISMKIVGFLSQADPKAQNLRHWRDATARCYREKPDDLKFKEACEAYRRILPANQAKNLPPDDKDFAQQADVLEQFFKASFEQQEVFGIEYEAAWNKLDDDLFNTARLITCGMYIQISIHDYLRALMEFHQFDTNFTLEPRLDIDNQTVPRRLGNQVTVEFNLLYRFHCAISQKDEKYTEEYMKEPEMKFDFKYLTLESFLLNMASISENKAEKKPVEP